jgi:hypothetical protein
VAVFFMPVIVLLAARTCGEGPGDRTREPGANVEAK